MIMGFGATTVDHASEGTIMRKIIELILIAMMAMTSAHGESLHGY